MSKRKLVQSTLIGGGESKGTNKRPKRSTNKIGYGSGLIFNLEWREEGESSSSIPALIYLDGPDATPSSKLAGFDIDSTIICTKSGRKFATGRSDWTFLNPSVPKKLKELSDDGTKIVFFTNQAGIEKGNGDPETLKGKFEDIINALNIPIQIFISTGHTHYRKPSVEMWNFMTSRCNGGLAVDLSQSLYVGDAAGRAKDWMKGKPKDFSCTDRMFAANVGVSFYTPETFFEGIVEAPFKWDSLSVVQLMESCESKSPLADFHKKNQEMVLLVGRPASGKSTFTKRYFIPHGYIQVNRDTLGTKEKCLKTAGQALEKKQSVVIDNTNPKKEDRKAYIDLAKKHGVPVRCLYLNVSNELSFHLNMFRQNLSKGVQRRVPLVAYRTFDKYFEEPNMSEGFNEVSVIDFVPSFDKESDKELFKHWTSM